MVLKVVVLLGIAIYCARNGEWGLAALAVTAIVPRIGLFLAILLAVTLAIKEWYWPAAIVGGLIVLNLVANKLMEPDTAEQG
ncbi:MAG TPA: hypothetical protein VF756_09505 [Thermoanaerobaculia bacterium]